MGSFADWCEKKVLDYVFSKAAWTVDDPIFCGLSTTTIDDTGGNITEPSGNNYSRVSITNNATNWPAATGSGAGGSSKKNGTAITFPICQTATWGLITDFFISSLSSGGNIYVYGALSTSKTIGVGDTASFAINDLNITLD